jgi:hypothetical protein
MGLSNYERNETETKKRQNETKKVTSLQQTFHFYYGSIGIAPTFLGKTKTNYTIILKQIILS